MKTSKILNITNNRQENEEMDEGELPGKV